MDGGLFAPPFFLTTDGGPSFPNGFNFPLALGDFDNDGQLDIAVGQLALGEVAVFFGNGDGSFSSAVEYASAFGIPANVLSLTEAARTHLVVVDLAAPSNDEGQVTVVDLQRDGGLSVIATVPLITNDFGDGNASIADLNGDGGIVIGDVNNDGRPDLIATDEYSQVVSVYFNCREREPKVR